MNIEKKLNGISFLVKFFTLFVFCSYFHFWRNKWMLKLAKTFPFPIHIRKMKLFEDWWIKVFKCRSMWKEIVFDLIRAKKIKVIQSKLKSSGQNFDWVFINSYLLMFCPLIHNFSWLRHIQSLAITFYTCSSHPDTWRNINTLLDGSSQILNPSSTRVHI